MTAAALAAVCERHGIEVGPDFDTYYASAIVNVAGNIERIEGRDATPDAAVCALLKARWGITTFPPMARDLRWSAARVSPPRLADYGPTELAAVVALADRLAQGGA